MPIFIIGGLVLVFLLFALIGHNMQKKQIQEILTDIEKLESIYLDFVDQKINQHIISSDDINIDIKVIHKEVIAYLRPHIDSVVNHINRLEFSDINIPNKSLRFNNVTSTAELLIIKKDKNEDKQLSIDQIDTFEKSVSDTVHSDLHERLLRLQ
jgi:hypothetical protein